MNTAAVNGVESVVSNHHSPLEMPLDPAGTVMIATMDSAAHSALAQVLEGHGINVEWVKGFGAAQELLKLGSVAACLCGFGLEDGSYKELVKLGKKQVPETPVVIISTPSCANEYAEYLAAMNAGAFDFLCYPYQRRELERILRLAVGLSHRHFR